MVRVFDLFLQLHLSVAALRQLSIQNTVIVLYQLHAQIRLLN